MRKKWLIRIILALIIAGAGYWVYQYNPQKKALAHTLAELDQLVFSRDTKRIIGFLDKHIADNAHITLSIGWKTFGLNDSSYQSKQEFSKKDFLRLIDLTLYSLDRYSLHSDLKTADNSPSHTLHFTFAPTGKAAGKTYYLGMGFGSHYALTGTCEGESNVENLTLPLFKDTQCELEIAINTEDTQIKPRLPVLKPR